MLDLVLEQHHHHHHRHQNHIYQTCATTLLRLRLEIRYTSSVTATYLDTAPTRVTCKARGLLTQPPYPRDFVLTLRTEWKKKRIRTEKEKAPHYTIVWEKHVIVQKSADGLRHHVQDRLYITYHKD